MYVLGRCTRRVYWDIPPPVKTAATADFQALTGIQTQRSLEA